jgi:protein-L-isoaspartate(D-aspartate) O-methyltransferase
MDEFTFPRDRMIQRLREYYKIRNEKVLEVMRDIPRHVFVPSALKSQTYGDNAVPIAEGQTLSQPFVVAKMTELLELSGKEKILEIGSGSGYQTAVLSKLVGSVFAIERIQILASESQERIKSLGLRNVTLRCGDGTLGWEIYSPFDGILIAAGSPVIPQPLVKQLKIGGKIVMPLGETQAVQKLVRITRTASGIKTEEFDTCAFVPLIGEHGWRN